MENFVAFLDKVIAAEDHVLAVKPRLSNTVGSAVKILDAALTVDLGNTEREVITRLSGIAHRLQTLVG